MNYKDCIEAEKAARVFEALSREDISAELAELIQGWIVSEDARGDENGVMDAVLDRMFDLNDPDNRPSTRTVETLANLHEILGLPKVEYATSKAKKPLPLRRTLLRVAAAVIPLAILGGVLLYTFESASTIAMVEVFAGEDGMVRLSDGSVARLLEGSRMEAAENFAENRHVTLSGEAFFSVTRDEHNEFSVEVNGLAVTVLGTEFNLKAWPDQPEKEVSLVTGNLEVEYGKKSVVLAPMEQLIYDEVTGNSAVQPLSPDKIDRWRSGRRRLNDLSLEQALNAVGGFYGKKVVMEGYLPADLGVSTVLTEQAAVESVLDAIRLMHDIFDYSIQGETIYIIGKK